MSKPQPKTTSFDPDEKVLSVRFIVSLLLMVAGIAYLAWYYSTVRVAPLVPGMPPAAGGSPKAIADLGNWNYALGFALIMVGLALAAHPTTPLGRGRGVVVGMLGCFLIGLLWICFYYVISDDPSKFWIFNDLQSYNLLVGIAFMAVGFTYATKWE